MMRHRLKCSFALDTPFLAELMRGRAVMSRKFPADGRMPDPKMVFADADGMSLLFAAAYELLPGGFENAPDWMIPALA